MINTQAQPEANRLAGKTGLFASLLVTIAAVVMGLAGTAAVGWVAGIGAALVLYGVWAGHRYFVAAGIISVAAASVVLTYDAPLIETLVVNALVATVCVAALMAIDLSFSTRRDTRVSPVTLAGFVWAHAVAAGVGIGAAVVALAVAVNVDWPGWLLLLPAVLLTVGALVLATVTFRYRKSMQKPPTRSGVAAPPISNQTWVRR